MKDVHILRVGPCHWFKLSFFFFIFLFQKASQAVKHNTIRALKGFTESNVCQDAAFSIDSEESAFILYNNQQMATEGVKQKERGAEWEVNAREFKYMHTSTVRISVEPLGVYKHTPAVYMPIVHCL